jgi:Xaa-Pro aminopeptidase
MMDQALIERVNDSFQSDELMVARNKTWEAVREIASAIRPGMKESEGLQIALGTLKKMGCERHWHRPHIRFGSNTLKTYAENSEADFVLKDHDLFFIDIGPVWNNNYEGDAGATFSVGDSAEHQKIVADVKTIFADTAKAWRGEGLEAQSLSGQKLYRYAEDRARALGWTLVIPNANGHRLSDFPHKMYYQGNLSDLDVSITPFRWVLEIQLRHPSKNFGAFYEDLLF